MIPDRSVEKKGMLARWSRLSLRSKGVAVLTIPLLALVWAQYAMYRVEGDVASVDQRAERFYDTRSALSQLRISLNGAQAAAGAYVATGERQFAVMFDEARESVNQSLNHLSQSIGSTADEGPLAEIRRQADQELASLSSLRQSPPDSSTAAPRLTRARNAMNAALASVASLSETQERQFAEARAERDLARRHLLRTLMACGILGPLGALFMNLVVAGRISRRITAVEENARRLAHGLPLEPFQRGSDEISALARQIEDAAYLLRKREREVKDNEQRYRDLFDRAPIAFEESDRDGVIRRFNLAVCNLLKSQPDQILGRKAWEFVAPDQQENFRQAMTERMATGTEAGPFECDYMLDDGSRIAVEIRENLVRDDREEVTGVVRSLLDVTERNLADMAARKVSQYAMELRNKNEQLARALEAAHLATEAKSRFLAGVSHELRTPLNGIIGFSELMYDAKLGPVSEDHKDVLSDILTSARHLLQLINDVLDLSKVEAGRMEFHPEPTRIDTLVYEVRDVVRPLAEKKRLNLVINVPSDLTAVVDPARFKQVLYNYLSNAVKFTPESGRVEVRIAREEESSFRLEVEDTGVGISPDEISKLFQEFQQLPNSRKAEQGTGLGLALTRHIVEAQGGSVSVRSVKGTGSVFAAVFPLVSIPISDGVPR
jgi:PAS domain S-box-containing protein